MGISLGLALGTSCGGKSSRDNMNGEGSSAAGVGTGGAPIASGGAAAQGGFAASNTGGEPASSGGMQANSGGMQASSGGMQANSGGGGTACVGMDGRVSFEFRGCLIDSDCAVLVQPTCCQAQRAIGVAKYLMCVASPPSGCAAVDCDSVAGFQTDDGMRTLNYGEVTVFCQFGEPGVGSCRTTLAGSEMDPPLLCAGKVCDAGELCVHRSARGGPGPRCFELPADGVCPADTELADCNGGLPGCIELLVEPEPECAAIPPGCGAPPGCSCLPPELCGLSQSCKSVAGRHVYCRDESP